MVIAFYISSVIAIVTTLLAVSRRSAVHALINLIVSLLAVAVVFLTLGAPFVAALEVIIYAGAIMVVFVFAVMLFNAGEDAELARSSPNAWILPMIATSILLAEVIYILFGWRGGESQNGGIPPQAVGLALYGPYVLGVELASMLLLSGLVGACRVSRHAETKTEAPLPTKPVQS